MLRGGSPSKIITSTPKKVVPSRYKARQPVHTETTSFNAVSKTQMYYDFGGEQIEIAETLDSRTCLICQPLDRKGIPLSQYEPGATIPPFRLNCRGTTCPYYDDREGERAARNADGEVFYVPAGTTLGKRNGPHGVACMLPQWENPAPGGIPEWLDKYGVASLLPGISPLCHVRFFSKAFSISAGYTFLIPYAYYFTNRPFQIQATRINILEYSLKIHKCDTFSVL